MGAHHLKLLFLSKSCKRLKQCPLSHIEKAAHFVLNQARCNSAQSSQEACITFHHGDFEPFLQPCRSKQSGMQQMVWFRKFLVAVLTACWCSPHQKAAGWGLNSGLDRCLGSFLAISWAGCSGSGAVHICPWLSSTALTPLKQLLWCNPVPGTHFTSC